MEKLSDVDLQRLVNYSSNPLESEMARELIALREAVRWKPITPDSLPKVGDEVLNPKHNSVTFVCADQQDVQGWLDEGYVLHRSITPPSAEGRGV